MSPPSQSNLPLDSTLLEPDRALVFIIGNHKLSLDNHHRSSSISRHRSASACESYWQFPALDSLAVSGGCGALLSRPDVIAHPSISSSFTHQSSSTAILADLLNVGLPITDLQLKRFGNIKIHVFSYGDLDVDPRSMSPAVMFYETAASIVQDPASDVDHPSSVVHSSINDALRDNIIANLGLKQSNDASNGPCHVSIVIIPSVDDSSHISPSSIISRSSLHTVNSILLSLSLFSHRLYHCLIFPSSLTSSSIIHRQSSIMPIQSYHILHSSVPAFSSSHFNNAFVYVILHSHATCVRRSSFKDFYQCLTESGTVTEDGDVKSPVLVWGVLRLDQVLPEIAFKLGQAAKYGA